MFSNATSNPSGFRSLSAQWDAMTAAGENAEKARNDYQNGSGSGSGSGSGTLNGNGDSKKHSDFTPATDAQSDEKMINFEETEDEQDFSGVLIRSPLPDNYLEICKPYMAALQKERPVLLEKGAQPIALLSSAPHSSAPHQSVVTTQPVASEPPTILSTLQAYPKPNEKDPASPKTIEPSSNVKSEKPQPIEEPSPLAPVPVDQQTSLAPQNAEQPIFLFSTQPVVDTQPAPVAATEDHKIPIVETDEKEIILGASPAPVHSKYRLMKIPELKALCKSKGLKMTGSKDELISRLEN